MQHHKNAIFSSRKKNWRTHSTGHEAAQKCKEICSIKKIDEGTVNRREAATTMKFLAQFKQVKNAQ